MLQWSKIRALEGVSDYTKFGMTSYYMGDNIQGQLHMTWPTSGYISGAIKNKREAGTHVICQLSRC
jgi:hypothetical protein